MYLDECALSQADILESNRLIQTLCRDEEGPSGTAPLGLMVIRELVGPNPGGTRVLKWRELY
jgi:hypothetical protein